MVERSVGPSGARGKAEDTGGQMARRLAAPESSVADTRQVLASVSPCARTIVERPPDQDGRAPSWKQHGGIWVSHVADGYPLPQDHEFQITGEENGK